MEGQNHPVFEISRLFRNFGPMNIKGILFDLDGVLIDSEESYTRFWNEIETIFPTGIPDYAHAIKGTTLSKILMHYPEGEVRDEIVRRIHQFENEIRYSVYPGVVEFLSDLVANQVRTAIVTSSDDVKMGHFFSQLPQMRHYFDAIVDGSMVSHSKPHPEPYLTGAAALRLSPEECVVFEDSFQGIESGLAAGCTVVGVAGTFPREEIEARAPHTVEGFKGLTLRSLKAMLSKP